MSKAAQLAAYQAGLKTALIEFTDGDDAIAIADAGVVTLLTTAVAKSEGGAVTTNIAQGLAKAWVEGSNAASLTDSFNISGGTDNGTGDYSYAFSNNMGSVNYSISVSCHSAGLAATNNDSQAAASYKVQVFARGNSSLGSASDQVNYSIVLGDLA